ncbi:MAG: O-antigen/teichoic acid export membrane protein [Myxococcota bacterium]|jgi:O-antigen/teichoic acid export membrane protein
MRGLGLRKLGADVMGTFARRTGGSLLQFVTVILVARLFGPEGSGAYSLVLLLPGMLSTFMNAGFAPANIYYLGSKRVDVRTSIRVALRLTAHISLIGVAIGALCLGFAADRLFPGIDQTLLWIGLAIFPLSLLLSFLSSVLQGLQRFKELNLVLLVRPGLTCILVAGMALTGMRELTWVIVADLVGLIAASVLILRRLRQQLAGVPLREAESDFRGKALHYGFRAYLSNILAFVNYRADLFLVNLLIDPAAAGIYAVSAQLARQVGVISQTVSTVLLPHLSSLDSEEQRRKRLTPLISRWVALITLLGAVALAIIAGPTLGIVFGSEFAAGFSVLLLLLPGAVTVAPGRILANDLASRGRPELNTYVSAVVVVVNLTGNLLLIPRFGLEGAATSTSLAYILNLILRLAVYSHFTGNRWADSLFVKPEDIRALLSLARR